MNWISLLITTTLAKSGCLHNVLSIAAKDEAVVHQNHDSRIYFWPQGIQKLIIVL